MDDSILLLIILATALIQMSLMNFASCPQWKEGEHSLYSDILRKYWNPQIGFFKYNRLFPKF